MQTTLIITAIVILAFVLLIWKAKATMKNLPVVEDHKNIIVLTEKNFQQLTKNKVILVDFWAAWCAPCKMMAPVLNDVAEDLKGNLFIGKLNVEEQQNLAHKYKVRSIPTFILFKNGQEINRFVGMKTKDFLIEQIKSA